MATIARDLLKARPPQRERALEVLREQPEACPAALALLAERSQDFSDLALTVLEGAIRRSQPDGV